MKKIFLPLIILTIIAIVSSGGSAYLCYQESANVTNQTGIDNCGGLNYSGFYSATNQILSITYKKPNNATNNSTWQVKHGSLNTYNISIPRDCWDYNLTNIFFNMESSGVGQGTDTASTVRCRNNSGYKQIGQSTGGPGAGCSTNFAFPEQAIDGDWGTSITGLLALGWYTGCAGVGQLYEEAIYWNIGSALNPSLSNPLFPYSNNTITNNKTLTFGINTTDPIYNHTIFNLTKLSDSSSIINNTNSKFITYPNLQDGQYYYSLTIYDITESFFIYYDPNITIDTISPSIIINSPLNGFINYTGTNIFINITSGDINFNYTKVNIYDSALNLINSTYNLTNQNFTYPYNLIYDGIYYINATACDLANNCNSTTNTVIIDNKKTFNFVSNLGAQLITNRLITLNDTTNNKIYNTTNGTLIFNITTISTNFTVTVNASYATESFNINFSTTTDTHTISLTPAITLTFRDEATQGLFNMSSPNTMSIEIISTDGNTTIISLTNTTPNPYSLNVTKPVSTIRFLEYYTTPNIITVYRTYLAVIAFDINNLATTIWLVDLRTTDVILNTLQIFDLMQDYQNPKVLVTRILNGTEQVITGDYADVEGKISAYLMAGAQYNIKIYSDNKPTRVVGKYYADQAGVKYLRLFDVVGIDQTTPTDPNVVTYQTYLANASGIITIYSIYNGTYVTSVKWDVYNQTSTGGLLTTSTVATTSGIFSYITNSSIATQYLIRMIININCTNSQVGCITPIIYDRTVSITEQISLPAQFQEPYTLKWIIFGILLIVALSLNMKTANIGSLLLVGLAIFITTIGWFTPGITEGGVYIVLGLAAVVALMGMFKAGSQK